MNAVISLSPARPRDIAEAQNREPVLDGIRGIAILLVLFHHLIIYSGLTRHHLVDKTLFTVGNSTWLGVDLFFVLSGFLITGILYDARGSARYFGSFYGRRILRIFPLYYGFLVVAFILVPSWLPAESAVVATRGQAWYWFYLSNVQVALWGWQKPLHLGHFWSLAIEEQFYLLWPLIVRHLERRRLLFVTALCFVTAFSLRLIAPFGLPALSAHVLMPTRMDALAAGAFLALLVRGPVGWRGIGASARALGVGCAVAGIALFVWRRGFREVDPVIGTVGLSLFAVGFASVIATALTAASGSVMRRILAAGPLVRLGQYSYGLYVFHQPVILVLRDLGWSVDMVPRLGGSQFPGAVAFALIASTVSVGCAVVSWHVWEQPFLRLKRYLPYQSPAVPVTTVLGSSRTNSVTT
jgi:peptidoglycan/LPS O-acetylase OafA/YrhL